MLDSLQVVKSLLDSTETLLTSAAERKENELAIPAYIAAELQKINEATSLIYHSLTTQSVKFSYPCFDVEVETLSSEDRAINDLENILADA